MHGASIKICSKCCTLLLSFANEVAMFDDAVVMARHVIWENSETCILKGLGNNLYGLHETRFR